MAIFANHISIVTVTYANKAETIASQALAETMMEKIAIDHGCLRVRCYLSGESTRMILFEYENEDSQMKVAEIYADLISYKKSKSNDRLKKDLYDLFMSLEPKFGCGENPDREKYIAEQLSNAIERYYK